MVTFFRSHYSDVFFFLPVVAIIPIFVVAVVFILCHITHLVAVMAGKWNEILSFRILAKCTIWNTFHISYFNTIVFIRLNKST